MKTPRALLIQGQSGPEDEQLLHIARQASPGRRWWWGVRRWRVVTSWRDGWAGGDQFDVAPENRWQTGAWCYLCTRPIATWSSRWPITVTAKLAVQRHRTEHIQGRLDAAPTEETA